MRPGSCNFRAASQLGDWRRGWWRVALAACLCFVLLARSTRAELTHRVVLLNPLAPDETTLEAVTRVRGELSAAGFDVVPVQHRVGADPREELESAARDVGALAGFAIFHIEAGDPIGQIIVLDRLRGKVLDQNLPIDHRNPRRTAAVLAVGAVELLKASLAEFWLSPVAPPPPRPVETLPPPPVVREALAPPRRFGMEAGVAVLSHLGKMTGVVSPTLKLSYRATDYFAARVGISSIGVGTRVEATAGSALVGQELATLDGVLLVPLVSPVRAIISAGAGAYHLHVQGIGAGANRGLTGSSWALALMPGLGARANLSARLALTAEAQLLFALPPTTVRVGAKEFGPAGDPSLVVGAGLAGIF